MSRLKNRWILALSLCFVVGLAWWTGKVTRFSSDPLSVLPSGVPEIEARRIYQERFLEENDLVIALKADAPDDPLELVESLAQFLISEAQLQAPTSQVKNGESGSLRYRYPWEADEEIVEMGALAAYAWVQASPAAVESLVMRLSDPEQVEILIADALETLSTSFSMGPEEAFLAVDPLKLSQVPGLPRLEGNAQEGIGFGTDDSRAILIDLPGDRNNAAEMARQLEIFEHLVWRWRSLNPGVEVTIAGYAPYIVELTALMRWELVFSAALTLFVVLILFVFVYRTAYPLVVLAVGIAITALTTVAIGGQLFGELNAISIGFAAILIALVVDYSIIVYQEQVQPSDPSDTFRSAVVRPVLWAAATTAVVFFALNLSSMPGIAQLGTMVAVGLVIGSLISLTYFRTLIARKKLATPRKLGQLAFGPKTSLALGLLLIAVAVGWLSWAGLPGLDTSAETLLPKHTESVQRYEKLREELQGDEPEPIAVLFHSDSGDRVEVREIMKQWDASISAIQGVSSATPLAFWPIDDPSPNLKALQTLVERWDGVIDKLSENFDDVAVGFAKSVQAQWRRELILAGKHYSLGGPSDWILASMVQSTGIENVAAKGLITTSEAWTPEIRQKLLELAAADSRVTLLGWDNLGPTMKQLYQHDARIVVLPSAVLLLLVLFLVFRSVRGVVLSMAILLVSATVLLALMRFFEISWNQINLMAVPLLLGASLDYNIHTQLALKRSRGNLKVVSQTLGKALLVCGVSTAVGFGSLGISRHPGLASLGQTCALGILSAVVVSVFLLPGWWVAVQRGAVNSEQ